MADTLISLAKSFPTHFLPGGKKEEEEASSSSSAAANAASMNKSASDNELPRGGGSGSATSAASRHSPGRVASTPQPPPSESAASSRPSSSSSANIVDINNDFWEILLRLDGSGASTSRGTSGGSAKGKQSAASVSNASLGSAASATLTLSLSAGYNDSPLGTLMEMLAHPVIKRTTQLTDRLLRLLSLVCITLTEEQPTATGSEASTANVAVAGGARNAVRALNLRRGLFMAAYLNTS